MFDTIIGDVQAILQATFLRGDWISLALAFGSVLAAALMMRRGGQIGSMTLLALLIFAIGSFLRGILTTPAGEAGVSATGRRVANQLEASWGQLMNLQAGTLLAYFLAFMVLIFLIFGLKSVLNRG